MNTLRWFTRRGAAALLLCGFPIATLAADDDSIDGRWRGEVAFGNDHVEVAFDFRRNDRGELVAYVYQPVLNVFGVAVPGTVVREEQRYVNREYAMSLARTGDALEGTMSSLALPITLRRTDALPAEAPVPDVPTGPGPRWRTKLGAPIYAAAAVRDGVAYVGTVGGVFQAVKLADDATGARRFRHDAGGKVRVGAVVHEGSVIVGSLGGRVAAVDAQTGAEKWARDLKAPVTTAPAIVAGMVIVGTRGSVLYALRPATGETVWRDLFWGSWVESEAVSDAGMLYIGSSDLRRVSAIDPKDGRFAWRTDVFGCPWGRPALTARRLYVGAVGTEPYAVRHLGSVVALERDSGRIALALAGARHAGLAPDRIRGVTRHRGRHDGHRRPRRYVVRLRRELAVAPGRPKGLARPLRGQRA